MPKSASWPVAGLILAAGLLECAVWPGGAIGPWLGPALVICLEPIFKLKARIYWLAAAAASLLAMIQLAPTIVWIVPLHWLFVFLANRKESVPLFLLAAASPIALFSLFHRPTWLFALAGVISLLLQYLLAGTLRSALTSELQARQKLADQLQVAHGIDIAGSVAAQAEKLSTVAAEMGLNTDKMYELYRQLEHLVRTNPSIPDQVPGQLLNVSQDNHQTKLRLGAQQAAIQDNLRYLSGKRGAVLSDICNWVSVKVQADAWQLGRVVHCQTSLETDPVIDLDQQLPLAYLLQAICLQESRNLGAATSWLSFASFSTSGKLRVIITLQKEGPEITAEWPTLRPLSLSPWAWIREKLTVECQIGTTSDGQSVVTVEVC